MYSLDPINDPQGGNPKLNRPFVVVSTAEHIATGAPVKLVGITGEITGDPDEIRIPHGWNCKTGLSKPSVAFCRWTIVVAQDRLRPGGFVMPKELRDIALKLRDLAKQSPP